MPRVVRRLLPKTGLGRPRIPAVASVHHFEPSDTPKPVPEADTIISLSTSKPDELHEQAKTAKRKAEWKRRQDGTHFLDHLILNIKGGKGGDGCVAFNREKFHAYGPPSGGNGGRGGDVYIQAVQSLTTLAGISKRVRAENGGNGLGKWRHGKNGAFTVIRVPVGTVVRELTDPRYRLPTAEENERQRLKDLGIEDTEASRAQRERDRKWVHYPTWEETNLERENFISADAALRREEAATKRLKEAEKKRLGTLFFDLDAPHPTGPTDPPGRLVARGGQGGFGNPFFLSTETRSPKFATRGQEGDSVTLELELKILADVGLVGLPNAGKSTLLRALTNSKAKVASYAFTTLNPQVGTVRMWNDGGVEVVEGRVIEDTALETMLEEEALNRGDYAFGRLKPKRHQPKERDLGEAIRFTIADNPGLIAGASENIGLGHSFLKSIERAPVLVYVVDLSTEAPWDDLRCVRDELEAYRPGLSSKARMVIANKADLLEGESGDGVALAKGKLQRLTEAVETMWEEGPNVDGVKLDVVPASAKHTQNIVKISRLLQTHVGSSRSPQVPP